MIKSYKSLFLSSSLFVAFASFAYGAPIDEENPQPVKQAGRAKAHNPKRLKINHDKNQVVDAPLAQPKRPKAPAKESNSKKQKVTFSKDDLSNWENLKQAIKSKTPATRNLAKEVLTNLTQNMNNPKHVDAVKLSVKSKLINLTESGKILGIKLKSPDTTVEEQEQILAYLVPEKETFKEANNWFKELVLKSNQEAPHRQAFCLKAIPFKTYLKHGANLAMAANRSLGYQIVEEVQSDPTHPLFFEACRRVFLDSIICFDPPRADKELARRKTSAYKIALKELQAKAADPLDPDHLDALLTLLTGNMCNSKIQNIADLMYEHVIGHLRPLCQPNNSQYVRMVEHLVVFGNEKEREEFIPLLLQNILNNKYTKDFKRALRYGLNVPEEYQRQIEYTYDSATKIVSAANPLGASNLNPEESHEDGQNQTLNMVKKFELFEEALKTRNASEYLGTEQLKQVSKIMLWDEFSVEYKKRIYKIIEGTNLFLQFPPSYVIEWIEKYSNPELVNRYLERTFEQYQRFVTSIEDDSKSLDLESRWSMKTDAVLPFPKHFTIAIETAAWSDLLAKEQSPERKTQLEKIHIASAIIRTYAKHANRYTGDVMKTLDGIRNINVLENTPFYNTALWFLIRKGGYVANANVYKKLYLTNLINNLGHPDSNRALLNFAMIDCNYVQQNHLKRIEDLFKQADEKGDDLLKNDAAVIACYLCTDNQEIQDYVNTQQPFDSEGIMRGFRTSYPYLWEPLLKELSPIGASVRNWFIVTNISRNKPRMFIQKQLNEIKKLYELKNYLSVEHELFLLNQMIMSVSNREYIEVFVSNLYREELKKFLVTVEHGQEYLLNLNEYLLNPIWARGFKYTFQTIRDETLNTFIRYLGDSVYERKKFLAEAPQDLPLLTWPDIDVKDRLLALFDRINTSDPQHPDYYNLQSLLDYNAKVWASSAFHIDTDTQRIKTPAEGYALLREKTRATLKKILDLPLSPEENMLASAYDIPKDVKPGFINALKNAIECMEAEQDPVVRNLSMGVIARGLLVCDAGQSEAINTVVLHMVFKKNRNSNDFQSNLAGAVHEILQSAFDIASNKEMPGQNAFGVHFQGQMRDAIHLYFGLPQLIKGHRERYNPYPDSTYVLKIVLLFKSVFTQDYLMHNLLQKMNTDRKFRIGFLGDLSAYLTEQKKEFEDYGINSEDLEGMRPTRTLMHEYLKYKGWLRPKVVLPPAPVAVNNVQPEPAEAIPLPEAEGDFRQVINADPAN